MKKYILAIVLALPVLFTACNQKGEIRNTSSQSPVSNSSTLSSPSSTNSTEFSSDFESSSKDALSSTQSSDASSNAVSVSRAVASSKAGNLPATSSKASSAKSKTTTQSAVNESTIHTVSPSAQSVNNTASDKKEEPQSQYKLILPTQSQLNYIAARVVTLVNAERQRLGVPALRVEPKLTQAAQIRAKETITNNWHTRPDGTLWATVLNDVQYGTRHESQASKDGINWYTEVSYDSGRGSENLARSWYDSDIAPTGFHGTTEELNAAAQKMFNDWKSSTGHYNNIKSNVFTATGVGCAAYIKGSSMSIQGIQIFTES